MIIYDLETTSLTEVSAAPIELQPRIMEVFMLKLDDTTLEERGHMHLLIDPKVPIPAEAQKITGIKPEMLKGQPTFAQAWTQIAGFFLGELNVAGHNLMYDVAALAYELSRIDKVTSFPWPPVRICTLELGTELSGGKYWKLGELHEHLFGTKHESAHRAEADVRATARCVRWFAEQGYIAHIDPKKVKKAKVGK